MSESRSLLLRCKDEVGTYFPETDQDVLDLKERIVLLPRAL
jgi:hypothetical protein